MYKNIRSKKKSIAPLQDKGKEAVTKRGRGRPKREHMKKYTIKMDRLLYGRVSKEADKLGTSNSFIISQGVRLYFQSLIN